MITPVTSVKARVFLDCLCIFAILSGQSLKAKGHYLCYGHQNFLTSSQRKATKRNKKKNDEKEKTTKKKKFHRRKKKPLKQKGNIHGRECLPESGKGIQNIPIHAESSVPPRTFSLGSQIRSRRNAWQCSFITRKSNTKTATTRFSFLFVLDSLPSHTRLEGMANELAVVTPLLPLPPLPVAARHASSLLRAKSTDRHGDSKKEREKKIGGGIRGRT